ncbi:MAG: bifunctional phosphoribosylaminoimidazolecarboxamide formyltransferase/IMP cyclohydrolase [Spirochaetes bacterium]|nr:bifunctional phosphoribosylaminoimidazolecarboxamide formyltransferase/IMP cyclohydrolase [Spirochaetota bacterium]
MQVKRALISVFHKEGIVEFATQLAEWGIEILSTGGTYEELTKNGINCVPIDEYTGQPEIFGGRVKTLHPLIHGGILSKRDDEAKQLSIKEIDLVVVNLYPFEEIVNKGIKEIDQLIEMIDIGGPTMLRAAAKNYQFCCPVIDPQDYSLILQECEQGGIQKQTRLRLALKVFAETGFYDSLIQSVLTNFSHATDEWETLPKKKSIPLVKSQELRYGENPHQNAGFYGFPDFPDKMLSRFYLDGKLHGKELSYNNIMDTHGTIKILTDLPDQAVVVIKHSVPCGAAIRSSVYESFQAAHQGDPVSIFGGIVGLKGIVDKQTAEELSKIFLEIIIAESFTEEALEILTKKKNIRLLQYHDWKNQLFSEAKQEFKKVVGGFLVQDKDHINPVSEKLEVVTQIKPDSKQLSDLRFAQTMVKHVKSNGIVIVKDQMLLGVGTGQTNRVTAAKIALDWAGDTATGAVLGSDAFFPMDDTVRLAAERGIRAIIQPGGSKRDNDSIAACNELNVTMVMTGIRHFYH